MFLLGLNACHTVDKKLWSVLCSMGRLHQSVEAKKTIVPPSEMEMKISHIGSAFDIAVVSWDTFIPYWGVWV